MKKLGGELQEAPGGQQGKARGEKKKGGLHAGGRRYSRKSAESVARSMGKGKKTPGEKMGNHRKKSVARKETGEDNISDVNSKTGEAGKGRKRVIINRVGKRE